MTGEPRGPGLFVLGSFVQALCLRVPALPGRGESLTAEALDAGPGGKGFNLAVGARRLGAAVEVLIAVGADAGGDWAAALLRQEGIATGHLLRLDAPTGQGVGLIDPRGDNCIAVYPGANALLQPAHVAAAASAIAAAGLVCAQFEIPEPPILAAFELARRHGVPTLLNAAPYRPLSPQLLRLTDTLVLNASEAACWLGLEPRQLDTIAAARAQLQALRPPAPGRIVITHGAQGCVARDAGGEILQQPAFAVEVVDSTGAGDAFCAGLACALVQGRGLAQSLRVASACGALTCTRLGVLPALPDAAALQRLLTGA
jgi:ribokinase